LGSASDALLDRSSTSSEAKHDLHFLARGGSIRSLCGYIGHGLCSAIGTLREGPGPKPRQLGRAEMTKARDREEGLADAGPASSEVSTLKLGGFTARLMIRHPLKRCPLPRDIRGAEKPPTAGSHRPIPRSVTMRLENITQPPAWLARRKEKAVIAGLMPCERSQGSISGNRALGKPLDFHSETRRGSRPNRRANALVPPKASIHSAAVEQTFIPPSYPSGSDSVNSRDKENVGLHAVVPIQSDCG
jgi:hypothetical protein